MHADPWPEDHLKRSYFTGGVCGDGTDVPCPDPALPIPTKRSGYINSDGELVSAGRRAASADRPVRTGQVSRWSYQVFKKLLTDGLEDVT